MGYLSKWIRTAYVICFILFMALTACTTADEELVVLQGATLFDGTGADEIENSVVVIRDSEIMCVGTEESCSIPVGAKVIDLSGRYIMPGLIDAHVHFFQTAFFDSRPDALDLRNTYPFSEVAAYQKRHPQRYYDAYLCSGVTGVYDVGGFTWSIDLQRSAERNPNAPHLAAAGPLITPATLDLFNLPSDKVLVNLDSEQTGRTTVQYLSALGSTGIKIWGLQPEEEDFMDKLKAVKDEIEKYNNKMIVHATTLDQAKAALEMGAELLVHSVSDQEVDEEFVRLAKSEGTIYTPTLTVSSGYTMAYRAAAGIADFPIDDPNGCVDTRTKERLKKASQFEDHPRFSKSFVERLRSFDPKTDRLSDTDLNNLKKVYEAGIPIAVGTDAGNPGTLHGVSIYDELEAMQQAGIPAEDLIVMATQNGAKAMEREQDFGTIETGKLANLIVLEEDPSEDIANIRSIERVMLNGRLENVNEIAGN